MPTNRRSEQGFGSTDAHSPATNSSTSMIANPSEYSRSIDASADFTSEHPYASCVSSRPAPACPSSVHYTETPLRTSQWTRLDRDTNVIRFTKAGGPPASSVIRREVTDARTGEIILDELSICFHTIPIACPPRSIFTTLTFMEVLLRRRHSTAPGAYHGRNSGC